MPLLAKKGKKGADAAAGAKGGVKDVSITTPKHTSTPKNSSTQFAGAKASRTASPGLGWALFRLARPKFLIYSAACHALGALYAARQGQIVDMRVAMLLQLTIWLTHIMTHFVNEFGDAEVDSMNRNAGAWTGGSKVLAMGWLPRWVAAACGAVFAGLAVSLGVATVWRFLDVHHSLFFAEARSAWTGVDNLPAFVTTVMTSQFFPWSFVGVGISVLLVAVAYSLPPLHLSANSLGELAVSYVLTFATPLTGLLIQNGQVDSAFIELLAPLFVVNAARMLIMNLPDRAGDAAGGKITSVVLIGEDRTVALHNVLTLATYLVLVPQLPLLSRAQRIAYCSPLALRWWQSLRLNSPAWWSRRDALADSIPFVESLYVLATVSALCCGVAWELRQM